MGLQGCDKLKLEQTCKIEEHPEHNTLVSVIPQPQCRPAQGSRLHEHVLDSPHEGFEQSGEKSDLKRSDVWVECERRGACV